MPPAPVEIEWARSADADDVLELLKSVATWLETEGPGKVWSASQFRLEDVAAQIAERQLVVLRADGQIAASNILQDRDLDFWPHDPPGEALYLHKLVVNRRFAGLGYGRLLLDWSADRARDAGCRYLRLDCIPRRRLVDFYLGCGFEMVGDEVEIRGFVVQRLQRPV